MPFCAKCGAQLSAGITFIPDQFIELIERYRKVGMNHFLFGDWGYDPIRTVEIFGTKILPQYGIKPKKLR
jgi:hypothetical protein